MLTLTSAQLHEKLRAWIIARMFVLLVGPPGTGKTYTSRKVAVEAFGSDLVEVLDGGNEASWKALFPYKTPNGELELGMALRASGYVVQDGALVKVRPGGALIIDECNRVPPELKTQFQLLASERIVPSPLGGVLPVDAAIVSTGNDSDLGVDEAARAELDRYDLIVRLSPTPEEMAEIVAKETGVRLEIAQAIYEAVADLASKLDPKKVHLPEGLRLAISVARILRTGTLGPVDCFRGTAERCWPLGRRGAEKYRAEFDGAVADVAGELAGKLANLGDLVATTVGSAPAGSRALQGANESATLADLHTSLRDATVAQISTGEIPLPRSFVVMMFVFIEAFGLGVAKHMMARRSEGKELAERAGVKLRFAKAGSLDTVSFASVERHRVEKFCKLCAGLK